MDQKWLTFSTLGLVFGAALLGGIGCNKSEDNASKTTTAGGTGLGLTPNESLTGSISVDGSSTVLPILERMAEEFNKVHKDVKITVSSSGTGGGFKKFSKGEIDIANASRAIEPNEAEEATKNAIEFVEIPIAFDGLSVVVNPQNDFVSSLTVAELKKIWEPGSKVKKWSDVRPEFPAEPIQLFGAGTDSGTFDYFTKAINGEEKASRSDYQASEDDNTIVQGVSGDKYALGYFGYAYYDQNKDALKIVPIDNGNGPIAPSPETIGNGTYQPLSRPLFIYVNTKAMERKEVQAFIKFIMENSKALLGEVGYVALSDEDQAAVNAHVESKQTGTKFHGAEVGVKIADMLKPTSGG